MIFVVRFPRYLEEEILEGTTKYYKMYNHYISGTLKQIRVTLKKNCYACTRTEEDDYETEDEIFIIFSLKVQDVKVDFLSSLRNKRKVKVRHFNELDDFFQQEDIACKVCKKVENREVETQTESVNALEPFSQLSGPGTSSQASSYSVISVAAPLPVTLDFEENTLMTQEHEATEQNSASDSHIERLANDSFVNATDNHMNDSANEYINCTTHEEEATYSNAASSSEVQSVPDVNSSDGADHHTDSLADGDYNTLTPAKERSTPTSSTTAHQLSFSTTDVANRTKLRKRKTISKATDCEQASSSQIQDVSAEPLEELVFQPNNSDVITREKDTSTIADSVPDETNPANMENKIILRKRKPKVQASSPTLSSSSHCIGKSNKVKNKRRVQNRWKKMSQAERNARKLKWKLIEIARNGRKLSAKCKLCQRIINVKDKRCKTQPGMLRFCIEKHAETHSPMLPLKCQECSFEVRYKHFFQQHYRDTKHLGIFNKRNTPEFKAEIALRMQECFPHWKEELQEDLPVEEESAGEE